MCQPRRFHAAGLNEDCATLAMSGDLCSVFGRIWLHNNINRTGKILPFYYYFILTNILYLFLVPYLMTRTNDCERRVLGPQFYEYLCRHTFVLFTPKTATTCTSTRMRNDNVHRIHEHRPPLPLRPRQDAGELFLLHFFSIYHLQL